MLYCLLMLCLVEFSVVLYCKEENTLVKYSFHRRFASVGSIPTMEQMYSDVECSVVPFRAVWFCSVLSRTVLFIAEQFGLLMFGTVWIC